MPQKHQVVRLELLALRVVGDWVKVQGRGLFELVYLKMQQDPNQGQIMFQDKLDYVRETLYSTVPWYFYEKMAVQVLSAVSSLVEETRLTFDNYIPMAVFLNKMKVATQLSEVVMHPQLKKLVVSDWPKIIRLVLNQNLSKLVGLEALDLGSGSAGWDISEAEKYILSSVQWMSNLTTFCLCFDCTDSIIGVLGSKCPLLKKLDVTSSRSVTDRSVPSLLKCKRLQTVNLYRTSISAAGYLELLRGLPDIQDFGRCDEFGKVLHMLEDVNAEPLPVSSLQCRDLTEVHLNLLVKYFPKLTSISLFHDERIADVTVLSALHHLKSIKLMNCDFFTDYVKELIEKCGSNLNSLNLEHVDEINLNALIHISQFCPYLKSLGFYNCEFVEDALVQFNRPKTAIPPFSELENLVCVSDCGLHHLKFLMSHCKNIKYIQLGSSTGINDATMIEVLSKNPMRSLEELRIQYSHDLSMQTVEVLMMQCEQLHRLSELESWDGISAPELKDFREYLQRSNICLDIRPTLSY